MVFVNVVLCKKVEFLVQILALETSHIPILVNFIRSESEDVHLIKNS